MQNQFTETEKKNLLDASNKKSTFCVLPWIHRFTNIAGDVQVCCAGEGYDNYVRKDNGEKINFQNEFVSDHEIMHSQYMRELRAQLLRGEWPEACGRCMITEQSGGKSRRHIENERYGADVSNEILNKSDREGNTTMPLLSHDFRLGNACNLACRMCSPHASTTWLKDWKKVESAEWHITEERMQELRKIDWFKNPKIKEQIREQLPHLRHLHFAGGEPLVMPEMVRILELCVESGYSKNIELTYNTNITRIPESVKNLWPKFREVFLLCSIDGFGELNEYIRHPSRWDDIHANLTYLDQNFKTLGLTGVLVMVTTQVYNIFQLELLYEYLANNFQNIAKLPVLTDLHWPTYYRTQVLPSELKQKAKESLERIWRRAKAREISGQISPFEAYKIEMIKGAIGFMELEDHSNQLTELKKNILLKDRVREQNFAELNPEIALEIFKEAELISAHSEAHI